MLPRRCWLWWMEVAAVLGNRGPTLGGREGGLTPAWDMLGTGVWQFHRPHEKALTTPRAAPVGAELPWVSVSPPLKWTHSPLPTVTSGALWLTHAFGRCLQRSQRLKVMNTDSAARHQLHLSPTV